MKFQGNPMRQEIFSSGLDVGPISAYLCCCGLAAESGNPSKEEMLSVWSEGKEALDDALAILFARNILGFFHKDGDIFYEIHPPEQWIKAS